MSDKTTKEKLNKIYSLTPEELNNMSNKELGDIEDFLLNARNFVIENDEGNLETVSIMDEPRLFLTKTISEYLDRAFFSKLTEERKEKLITTQVKYIFQNKEIIKNIEENRKKALEEIKTISKNYIKADLEKLDKQKIDLIFFKLKDNLYIQLFIFDNSKSRAIKWLKRNKLLKEDIIKQNYYQPENFNQALIKVIDEMTEKDFTKEGEIKIPSGKKTPIVKVQLTFSSINDVLPKQITKYQREVLNGIFTILESGQNIMTDKQIYEVMTGSNIKNSNLLKPVNEAVKTLRTTLLTLDWTEHGRLNTKIKENIKKYKIDSLKTTNNIINAEQIKIKAGGQKVSAYIINKPPALYTYAKALGQISTTPKKILQIPTVSNTEDTIPLKNYLMREIEHMNNRKDWERKILIQRLIDKGYIRNDSHKSRRIKQIEQMLDYWRETTFIKDYEIEKRGKTIRAFTITPNPNYKDNFK